MVRRRLPAGCWAGWTAALVGLTLALAGFVGSARADSAPSDFEAGNKLYEQGKYSEAVGVYERLAQTGEVSLAILFNLGNARFKAGQMGRAIAAYREAERLAPRDPDVRANLRFARNQVEGPSRPASRWHRWLGALTANEWTTLAAAAFWLLFLLLAAMQWRPALARRLRTPALAAAGALVAFAAGLGLTLANDRENPVAIVTAREVVVRAGPFDDALSAFNVHDGAELTVLDRKDDWFQVSDGGKHVGWLKREAVEVYGETHTLRSGAAPRS